VNRAIFDIREGETVTLPCRHCASVSIRLVVQAGVTAVPCPKCRELTSFQVGLRSEGLELRSQAVRRGEIGFMG
jgi:phage FluMu protein Com